MIRSALVVALLIVVAGGVLFLCGANAPLFSSTASALSATEGWQQQPLNERSEAVLIRQLLDARQLMVSDEEVQREYERMHRLAGGEESVFLKSIDALSAEEAQVYIVRPLVEKDALHAWFLEQLQQDPSDEEQRAYKQAVEQSSSKDAFSDAVWLSLSDLDPWMVDALNVAEVAVPTAPVRSRLGYHVFLVEVRDGADRVSVRELIVPVPDAFSLWLEKQMATETVL